MPTTHETAREHRWRRRVELDRKANERAPEAYVRLGAHEIAAILALARLDVEVAVAYETSAQAVDEEPLGNLLLSFADEHRQHVEDLVLLARGGGTEVEPTPPPLTSPFVALATSFGKLNRKAALEGLVANEDLTGATYDTLLWLITDDEALALLRENREDERRHREALTWWMTKHG